MLVKDFRNNFGLIDLMAIVEMNHETGVEIDTESGAAFVERYLDRSTRQEIHFVSFCSDSQIDSTIELKCDLKMNYVLDVYRYDRVNYIKTHLTAQIDADYKTNDVTELAIQILEESGLNLE